MERPADTTEPADTTKRRAERRLPMALAVVAVAGLYLLLPDDYVLDPSLRWVFPAFVLGLLALLVLGDPGRIDRTDRWLRLTTGVMIGVITLATAGSAVRLVAGILTGAQFDGAAQLLLIGAVVWTTNVIAFALWYWHLDRGGPAERARGSAAPPSFRFPEEDLPDVTGAGWVPQFVDYFAVSYNTATAFSPADVSAIRPWAKLWMIAESAVSLALVGLVLADAINAL
jgi:hypothetical protein